MKKVMVKIFLVVVVLLSGCVNTSKTDAKIESIAFGADHIVSVFNNGEILAWEIIQKDSVMFQMK